MATHRSCMTGALAIALASWAALSSTALSGCKLTTSGLRTTHTASATGTASTASPPAHSDAASRTTASASGSAGAPNTSTGERPSSYDEKGFVIRRNDPGPPQDTSRSIWPRELASLYGLRADQARQRLEELGHTGEVRVVTLQEQLRRCAPDTVCMIHPSGGVRSTHAITLYLNGTFKIAPPPP